MSNYQQQNNNQAPIPPGLGDVMSNWLYADPVTGSQKRPNFRLKTLGNVPRFIVKTNVPDDRDNGRIEFHSDLATFSVIVSFLERLGKGEDEGTYTFEYNDHIFIKGQRSEKPVTKASIKIGVDKTTGRIYIAVLGYNRPKIQFFFGPSNYHAMKAGDGSELDVGLVSRAYALGCAREWAVRIPMMLVNEFNPDAKNVAKAPGAPGGGQQQGGGNNYQQRPQQNNYQQPQAAPPAPTQSAEKFDDAFADDDWA